jgi:hypothetical protein
MVTDSGSSRFREDRSMDPFTALTQARNYVRLAEEANDNADRERHLRSARSWLQKADVKGWFQRKPMPAVIIAVDGKQIGL